mgnify:CR=1 FL=1
MHILSDAPCKACGGKGWGLFIDPPGDWTYSGQCWMCKGKGVVAGTSQQAEMFCASGDGTLNGCNKGRYRAVVW